MTAAQTAVTAAQEAVTAAVDYDSAVAAQTAAASAVTLAATAVVAAQASVDAAADTDSADDNTAAATVLGTAQGLATDAGTADTNADSAFATLSSLQASVSSVNEGSTVIFTLDGGAAAAGKTYSYSITGGVDTSDITSGSMIGTVVADSNGVAIAQVTLNSDVTTEGAESLTVTMNRKTATVTVNDTSAAPAAQTDFTITAAQIVTNNAIAGANQMAVTGTDSGTNSVTIQSSAVTSDGGFVYAGDADVTITSGVQGDSITVVSEGDSTITSGAGDDTITIVGGGSNTINVGAGQDTVTGGTGSDNIVMGSGETGAGDVIDGGLGNDTLTISGDGNVIGAAGATLTSIENIVLDGTTLTIDQADLEALTSVSGDITTSEITADVANGATLDLSGVSLSGVKSLTADDNVTVILNATQIGQIGAITTAAGKNLTINTDVAGLTALGAKATAGTGGAVTLTVTDTNANILAGAAIISSTGATAVLSGTVTVAEALTALATNAAVTYNLSDTAANLANASEVVYNNTLLLSATTNATAFEATQIHAMITASNVTTAAGDFVAADVTLNVSDTASNVANSLTDSAIASDAVATSDTSSAAEALASYTNNNAAVFSITDTAANLATEAANSRATLNTATSITYSDAATVAEVAALNAASTVDAAAGYALNDTQANLIANATVTGSAGNITVNDASITVAQGLAIEALENTGTNAYVIADTVGTALAASAAVTSSTTAISTSDATITVAQANALVSKYGASKVTDTTFDIADTAANLVTLSAASIAEADAGGGNEITMTGTATVSQALNINAAVSAATLDLTTMAVSDTAANILAGTADATNVVVLDDQASITVTGATDVATITAINADLLAETTGAAGLTEVADGYTLTDTYALLLAANGANGVVDNSGTVNVSDAVTVAQITNITTAMDQAGNGGVASVPGTTLNYSLTDSAANVIADATYKAAATSISVTDAAVTLAQATALEALTAFTDAYAISDTVANLFNATTDGNVVTLNAATSVTVRDTVANLEAANGLTAIGLATTDAVVVADTEANLSAATTAKTNATSFVITDAQTTADVTTVNALAALKPTTYSMTDTTALMLTGLADTGVGGANETGAVTTLLNGATMITSSTATSVADFNTLDAGTTSSITADITDTIANLTAATGATALANVLAAATGGVLVISDTNGTVAQIAALSAAGATVTGLTIVDTAANLTGATAALIAGVAGVNAPSDNGTVTHDVASLTTIYSNNGSAYASYNLSDTVANVVAAIGVDDGLVNFAQSVTATGDATVAEATTMQAETTMGSAIAYSITDTATLIAGGAAAVLNAATNLTANTAATVAEASTINAATNSGTTAYECQRYCSKRCYSCCGKRCRHRGRVRHGNGHW